MPTCLKYLFFLNSDSPETCGKNWGELPHVTPTNRYYPSFPVENSEVVIKFTQKSVVPVDLPGMVHGSSRPPGAEVRFASPSPTQEP
jgi:hypothetical protein